MNEQSTNNQPYDRHEARRQRRAARRELLGNSSGASWVAGLILILLGGAFLLQNMGKFFFSFTNWWALFILIPAVGALDAAWRMYRNADNHLTVPARGSLLAGLVLTLVAFAFLFNINWTYFGPALIILAGLGILVNAMLPTEEQPHDHSRDDPSA